MALFVAGADRSTGSDGGLIEVINPSTGNVAHTFPAAGAQDCRDAVDALAAAQRAWEATAPSVKRDVFLRAAELVQTSEYKERIRQCMSDETSAVPAWIHVNVIASVNGLKQAAALCSSVEGRAIQSEKPGCGLFVTRRAAAGVVLAIAPWNAPINLAIRAIAVPLLCGNTVLLKGSEYSPRSQRIVVDLLLASGLPPSTLAYVAFTRSSAPALTSLLISSPAIRRANFTGSATVGRLIAAQCGKELKPCVLELGGSAPVVVMEDADLEGAAKAVIFGGVMHSGQVCMSTERVLVHSSIHDAFLARLVQLASAPPLSTQLGPLLTSYAADRVVALLRSAVAEGAKLDLGDLRADGGRMAPHILSGVTPGMEAWKEELFGPCFTVTKFESAEEGVRLANESEYSLIAGLWTESLEAALKWAPLIRAGSVQVNGATIHVEPAAGNAGLGGESGYGRFDVEHFTDQRSVAFHLKGEGRKFPLVG